MSDSISHMSESPTVLQGRPIHMRFCDGWIHCRVQVKPVGFSLTREDKPRVVKRLKFDKDFEKSVKHLYKKDQHYPCPDCKAWYGGDTKRIQFSCRHREKSESEADLKIWDIGFPESDDDD